MEDNEETQDMENGVVEQQTLTTQDIANAVKLIEIAFQRGAFQASEGKEVGEIYERLLNFVRYTIYAQQQEEEQNYSEENQ